MNTFALTAAACIIMSGCAIPALANMRDMLAEKTAFLRMVDESITGDQIAALPFKYVGKRVDLTCVVQGTDYPGFFDAACPKGHLAIDAPGYSRTAIKTGQRVRILGIVERPWGATGSIDEEVFAAVGVHILLTKTLMMERRR